MRKPTISKEDFEKAKKNLSNWVPDDLEAPKPSLIEVIERQQRARKLALTLSDIIVNEMSVGYFSQMRKWNASLLREMACGSLHCISCYAPSLQEAVQNCLDEAMRFQCSEDHDDEDGS